MDDASELNKRKVRLFVEAVWNEGRLELIDELVAADYVGRDQRVCAGSCRTAAVRTQIYTSRSKTKSQRTTASQRAGVP